MNKNYIITSETYQFIEKTQKRFIKSKKRVQDFVSFISPKLPNEKTTFENDVEKYEYKKNKSVKLNHSTLQSVSDCGSWLTFRNYYNIDKTTLHTANFCKKDKLCPACATRRASKQVKKVYNIISGSEQLKKKHWYYIVLPVKHNISEDYETVFNRAKDGLQKLRKSLDNARQKKSKNFFSNFDGMFYSFEVTKSKNGWNVHINLLCCSDNEIQGIYNYTQKDGKTTSQHKDIMRDWSKYTDNQSFMHSINKIDTRCKDDLTKNLLEVFKYALKFQELKNEDLFEVYEKSFGKRLIGAFGSLYNIKLDVQLENEDLLDQEFLELVYRFNYAANTYEEYQREFKKEDTLKQKTITKLNRSKLIRDKKPDFVKISIYDKDKNLQSLQIKRNVRSITDFEIFSYSLYRQKNLS